MKIIGTFLMLLCVVACSEDEILPTDITLSTQEQVDQFTASTVDGDLTITGPEITNLDALKSLKHIKGHFYIRNTYQLTKLEGLKNLGKIDSSLLIYENYALQSVDDLDALCFIDKSIHISHNDNLVEINFSSTNFTYEGDIIIFLNPELESISFNGILDRSSISLSHNDKQTDLPDLGKTSHLNYLSLTSLKSFKTLSVPSSINRIQHLAIADLNHLEEIIINAALKNMEGLSINNNPLLTSLDGLASIIEIKNRLMVVNNVTLSDLCGLYQAISTIDYDKVIIYNNQHNPTKKDFELNNCKLIVESANR
ncbi:hypothetical protein [Carboxylicivirga sp. N1Y90]|uniref:hypothetical protein n=1 Tax=Carboxylicivirga fragile TaxID=3417571 RepID=UPI003D34013A|nr:hypothetical protein [Marinilabiliaceae bacterium N1Y90]